MRADSSRRARKRGRRRERRRVRAELAERRRLNFARFASYVARGVYPPPSQFEAWFPSIVHTDEALGVRFDDLEPSVKKPFMK
mgnify:CR=1 FL=1